MVIEDKKMAKILAKVPPETPDLDDWIRQELVVQSFIIYNTRENTAICTRCGSTNLIGREYTGRHGEKTRCPECETEVTILSEGRGRQCYTEAFRLLTWTRKGKAVYGRLYEIDASFEIPGIPRLQKWLKALYIVNA